MILTSQARVFVFRANLVDSHRLPAEDRQDKTMPQILMSAELKNSGRLRHTPDCVVQVTAKSSSPTILRRPIQSIQKLY